MGKTVSEGDWQIWAMEDQQTSVIVGIGKSSFICSGGRQRNRAILYHMVIPISLSEEQRQATSLP